MSNSELHEQSGEVKSLPADVMSESIEYQIKYIFSLVRASGKDAEDMLVAITLDLLNQQSHSQVSSVTRDFSPMGYQKSGGSR